jgi:hypothetical protein
MKDDKTVEETKGIKHITMIGKYSMVIGIVILIVSFIFMKTKNTAMNGTPVNLNWSSILALVGALAFVIGYFYKKRLRVTIYMTIIIAILNIIGLIMTLFFGVSIRNKLEILVLLVMSLVCIITTYENRKYLDQLFKMIVKEATILCLVVGLSLFPIFIMPYLAYNEIVSQNMNNEVYDIGEEAVLIIDEYLNGERSSQNTMDALDALYVKVANETFESDKNVRFYISCMTSELILSSPDKDYLLMTRDNLSHIIGLNKPWFWFW